MLRSLMSLWCRSWRGSWGRSCGLSIGGGRAWGSRWGRSISPGISSWRHRTRRSLGIHRGDRLNWLSFCRSPKFPKIASFRPFSPFVYRWSTSSLYNPRGIQRTAWMRRQRCRMQRCTAVLSKKRGSFYRMWKECCINFWKRSWVPVWESTWGHSWGSLCSRPWSLIIREFAWNSPPFLCRGRKGSSFRWGLAAVAVGSLLLRWARPRIWRWLPRNRRVGIILGIVRLLWRVILGWRALILLWKVGKFGASDGKGEFLFFRVVLMIWGVIIKISLD